jgi:hypothetical protein
MGEIIELAAKRSDSNAGLRATWRARQPGSEALGLDWRPAA